MRNLATIVLFASLGTIATASSQGIQGGFASGSFAFSTEGQQPQHKKILRQRRTKVAKKEELPKQGPYNKKAAPKAKEEIPMTEEDKQFWDRILDEQLASIPSTPAPTPCPTNVAVDCVSDNGVPCTDLKPPESGTGDACIVTVVYTVTIFNAGDDNERVYSISITQDGNTKTFITTDLRELLGGDISLNPGETISFSVRLTVDICQNSDESAFDFQVDVVTGPPCDVKTTISCVSEEGEECGSISPPPTPDDCLLDVIYTYDVENTGLVDANIIYFQRERDGDELDLMPLLDDTYIAIGDKDVLQETEQINRCEANTFTTNTVVFTTPNADLLCPQQAFYP